MSSKIAHSLFALRFGFVLLVFSPTAAAHEQASLTTKPTEYKLGPHDVLMITVWDQTDLAGKFTVDVDGTFTFPLIGRLKVGGLTLRQVEEELQRKLKDGFFRNPQITIAIEQYRSQRVFIVGEVRNPGTYSISGDMTLIEALARAGSTLPTAGGAALIVRPLADNPAFGPLLPSQGGASEVIKVDLQDLQSGRLSGNAALSGNATLRDGDTIFVARAETVYVFGQVRNPGAYSLQRTDTTVLQALSLAGGVTDRGSTTRIQVVRLDRGEKKEVRVKLSDLVRAGDTIIVPERFF